MLAWLAEGCRRAGQPVRFHRTRNLDLMEPVRPDRRSRAGRRRPRRGLQAGTGGPVPPAAAGLRPRVPERHRPAGPPRAPAPGGAPGVGRRPRPRAGRAAGGPVPADRVGRPGVAGELLGRPVLELEGRRRPRGHPDVAQGRAVHQHAGVLVGHPARPGRRPGRAGRAGGRQRQLPRPPGGDDRRADPRADGADPADGVRATPRRSSAWPRPRSTAPGVTSPRRSGRPATRAASPSSASTRRSSSGGSSRSSSRGTVSTGSGTPHAGPGERSAFMG